MLATTCEGLSPRPTSGTGLLSRGSWVRSPRGSLWKARFSLGKCWGRASPGLVDTDRKADTVSTMDEGKRQKRPRRSFTDDYRAAHSERAKALAAQAMIRSAQEAGPAHQGL